MNPQELLSFIAKAHRCTYAAPREVKKKYRCKEPISPGHKDYDFVDGDWRYHDSYSGRRWAPGKEVVFFKEKPIWQMSYQGKVADDLDGEFIESVYSFLKKALMDFDEGSPFRGPACFVEDDFEYSFSIDGDYSYFTGRESVKYKGKEVFFQDVMGSLVK